MRARMLLGPRWVLALFYAIVFGSAMGVFVGIDDGSVVTGVVVGVVGGVAFSAFMTPLASRYQRGLLDKLGGLTPERYVAASAPSWRGPAPIDPLTRRDALVLASESLRQALHARWASVGLFGSLTALEVGLVVSGTYDTAWTIPVFVAFVVFALAWPRHMRHRVALLRADAS